MYKKLEEKSISIGLVEERRFDNFRGLDRWHFTCEKCKQRMRVKSGPADYDCPMCKTSYKVSADGKVFRVELIDVEDVYSIATQNRNSQVATRSQPSGGLLGRFVGAVKDANEEAHGKRLVDELNSTSQTIKRLD